MRLNVVWNDEEEINRINLYGYCTWWSVQFGWIFKNFYARPAALDYVLRAIDQRARASMRVQRLALFCPTWQRPASTKMASLRTRSLFLLENSVLKFVLSGVKRRSTRDIFESRYQLGGILSPLWWAKERFHQIFWVLPNVAFDIWLYSAGFTTAHVTYINKFSENIIHGKNCLWHCGKSKILHI